MSRAEFASLLAGLAIAAVVATVVGFEVVEARAATVPPGTVVGPPGLVMNPELVLLVGASTFVASVLIRRFAPDETEDDAEVDV